MQITVTATAVRIPSDGGNPLVIQNLDAANPVYLGRLSTVTATGVTGGIKLMPGGTIDWSGKSTSGPFLVCASGQTALVAYENV